MAAQKQLMTLSNVSFRISLESATKIDRSCMNLVISLLRSSQWKRILVMNCFCRTMTLQLGWIPLLSSYPNIIRISGVRELLRIKEITIFPTSFQLICRVCQQFGSGDEWSWIHIWIRASDKAKHHFKICVHSKNWSDYTNTKREQTSVCYS